MIGPMPRTARSLVAGGHYHLINRGNNRAAVFLDHDDFEGFVRLMAQAQRSVRLAILAVCVMPNHFHIVVSQRRTDDISRWMHWLLTTHSHRYHLRHGTSGRVWQGRFKAFGIERDAHLLTVMRYVERNALRARLVDRAEDWAWCSLAWRDGGPWQTLLQDPPVVLPRDWPQWVNAPQSADELAELRSCVNHQRPYGSDAWREECAAQSGRIPSPRGRGRPRKIRAEAGTENR